MELLKLFKDDRVNGTYRAVLVCSGDSDLTGKHDVCRLDMVGSNFNSLSELIPCLTSSLDALLKFEDSVSLTS